MERAGEDEAAAGETRLTCRIAPHPVARRGEAGDGVHKGARVVDKLLELLLEHCERVGLGGVVKVDATGGSVALVGFHVLDAARLQVTVEPKQHLAVLAWVDRVPE